MFVALEDSSGFDWSRTDFLGIALTPDPLIQVVEAQIRSHKGHGSDEIIWQEGSEREMWTTFVWEENGNGPSTHTYSIFWEDPLEE